LKNNEEVQKGRYILTSFFYLFFFSLLLLLLLFLNIWWQVYIWLHIHKTVQNI